MLTVFAMPKPFQGHIATIQRNAIASWAQLRPACEILLFGNEHGTAQTAEEFGIRHAPEVAHNKYHTPLVNDLFARAEQLSSNPILCYVNSDIILMKDFVAALQRIARWSEHFLMVGECWNLDLTEALVGALPDWEKLLCDLVRQKGKPRGPHGIDYFAFSRGLYGQLPPFCLGRAHFDNWLIWRARFLNAAVVDATRLVLAVHQNHDYSHVSGGIRWSYEGEEAQRNLELAGGRSHCYLIFDASHRLGTTGIRRNFAGYLRIKSRWTKLRDLLEDQMWSIVWKLAEATRPARHAVGLNSSTLKRLKACLGGQRRT